MSACTRRDMEIVGGGGWGVGYRQKQEDLELCAWSEAAMGKDLRVWKKWMRFTDKWCELVMMTIVENVNC